MSRILITGGAGFIGSHTAEALLRDGHQVRILDNLDGQVHGEQRSWPKYLHQDVETILGDVRNAEQVDQALEDIDAVYHFAALTGVGQSMYEMQRYVATNVAGTAVLLDAVIARHRQAAAGKTSRLKRFILATSRAMYGEGTFSCQKCGEVYPSVRRLGDMQAGDFDAHCPNCQAVVTAVPTSEERPCRPISVYGSTKLHQEEYAQHAARAYGLPVTCLRYFNVYGARQSLSNPYTGVVSGFYSRLRAGQPISLYEHGRPLRDFVHVSDVVQANLLALETEIEPGTCLNIGTGRGHSIEELALTLRDVVGQGGELQDTGKFRVGDVWACHADIRRARKLLGYNPRVDLRQGLAAFVAWAQDQQTHDGLAQTEAELAACDLMGNARRPDA